MIKLGTEIIREKIDPDFHINRLIEDIRVLSYFYDIFVVSDIRFPVEIEKPREEFDNVIAIKMKRHSDELNEEQKKHITETGLDNFNDFDYEIDNSKSLEELNEKAKELLVEIGE